MECAFCDGALVEVSASGVDVDRCNRCQAVFFEAGELAAYTGKPELEARSRDAARQMARDQRNRKCPACAGPMNQAPGTAGHFDVCPDCGGIALDLAALTAAGSLAALIASESSRSDLWERFSSSLEGIADVSDIVDAVDRESTSGLLESAGELAEGGAELIGGLAEGGVELLAGLLEALGEIASGL